MWEAVALAVKGFVEAILQRFCPAKTPADTELEVMTENAAILEAEASAKAKAPRKLSELIKLQRAGKLSLLLCLFLMGCAFNQQTSSVCPQIRDYTAEEQTAQAEAEEALPPDSPLIDPLLEWAGIRSELRACHAAHND